MTELQQLHGTFSALAHPVRLAMLERLAQGEATVNELAQPFAMSLPAVSRHIKVLEKAGLISRGNEAQFRPCRLNPTPLEQIASWAEQYRPIWEARFDQMQTYLNNMAKDSDER
ncbi:MAG: metalloregulator ArsR/SmtB family transcription factor [Pseudomonadota bacterium]